MRFPQFIALVMIFLAGVYALGAQTVVQKVRLLDRDLDMPLEGVQITLVGEPGQYYSDVQGVVLLTLNEAPRHVILAQLPGYEVLRVPFQPRDEELVLEMVLAGVVQGEELVVERRAPGQKDETPGVSVVMDAQEMDSTANIGLVEDVMSSIKTLPGVGYTGGFNARPSIRGGDPGDLACVLDGFYVVNPYHWGGGFSIFNPYMVESAKLSHGIFSSRYGRALSGLLEITSKKPDEPRLVVNGGVSTTSTDLFLQTPLGGKGGLFLGGKITYLDLMKLAFPTEMTDISVPPYIRVLSLSGFYNPSDAWHFYLNGFVGFDGVGTDMREGDDLVMSMIFDYSQLNSFLSGGIRWLPSPHLNLRLSGGVNRVWSPLTAEMSYTGTRDYSDEFIDEYEFLLGGATSYTVEGLGMEIESETDVTQGQLRLEGDILLGADDIFSLGTETVYTRTSQDQRMEGWFDTWTGSGFELQKSVLLMQPPLNQSLNSAAYLFWEHGSEKSTLSSELGVRLDHFYLWNKDMSLNTYPVADPRLSLRWTPLRDRGAVEALSFSGGTGLFSVFPFEANVAEEKYGIGDFELGPDRAVFGLLGTETRLEEGWKFQLEGYYKYYLNRLVITADEEEGEAVYSADSSGTGHVIGADLMLQKKNSRYWDGYLTYSYVWARYYNPSLTGGDDESLVMPGGPLDQWYYPSFHRFHSLNLVANWKPLRFLTLTVKGSLATGQPRQKAGKVTVYPANYEGTIVERYSRTSEYSDTLRNGISAPLDLRISWSNSFTNSRVIWEYYLGVQDVLVNLYTPAANTSFDAVTGEEQTGTSADFNIGIPIISFGYKLSY